MFDLIYPPVPAPEIPAMMAGARTQQAHRPVTEMFPLIDENGIVTGQAARSYVHGGSRLLHPVVHLHVVSRHDNLLMQKRSPKKDICPLMWDTAVGGHVTYGEQIQEALFREASEELGLRDFNPLFIDSYVYENSRERELVCIFAAVGDFAVTPDPEEVIQVKWWPFEDIQKNLGKSVFTPNFEGEFTRISGQLKALL